MARPSGYLTRQEAAERIGIHPDHLLRLIKQGKVALNPYYRPAWRARAKMWLQEHEVAAVAAARQTLRS